MGVRSGRTSVGDLSFRVYSRALHPDWVSTRMHRRLTFRHWSADLRIIDGGHLINWSAGPVRLSEILIGNDCDLPDLGLAFKAGVRHERSTTIAPHPSVQYQTCVESERVDAAIFSHLCDEFALDSSRHRLFHRAKAENRLAPQPLCLLRIEAAARRLSVFAVHTFPDELSILRTESLFEIRE